jgi:hypothetical protein
VAQEGGLAHSCLAVELYRRGRLEGVGCRADFRFPIQHTGKGTWAQEDGRGARLRAGLLFRQGDIDHAAVDGADLDDVIPDGNLSADLSLDLRLYISGREGLSHGCFLFSLTILAFRLTADLEHHLWELE